MGGNLFKAGRISSENYFALIEQIKPVLEKNFGDRYRIPMAYRSKKDYGDADILVDAGILMNRREQWKEDLKRDLGVTQSKSVGNVFSMLYQNFQVDIFVVGTNKLETAYHFMSYNILGNLIGRIYHKFNLKFGEDGLHCVLRSFTNHVTKEVLVSRDMEQMLGFIGLSYQRWLKGFDHVEEIFEYVVSSPYFCSDSYDPQYFNIKKRLSERPDFVAFLDYLERNNINKNYPFDKNKEMYLAEIDAYFKTSLQTVYAKHVQRQEKLENVSKKFNGRIIMELTGIEGKVIGGVIEKFRDSFENEELFEDFVLQAEQETINTRIMNIYATMNRKE